jgi:hypothetical protein
MENSVSLARTSYVVAGCGGGVGVAVASDGVGDATGSALAVGVGVVTVGDDGRDVDVGVVSSPPQATATNTPIARAHPSQPAANLALLIANLH